MMQDPHWADFPDKPDLDGIVDLSVEDDAGVALLSAVQAMVEYVEALEKRIRFLEGGE